MRTHSRRQDGWAVAGALAFIVSTPALAHAQQSGLFPLAPIQRQRTPCPMEDPVYRMYRQQYFGYHPTCWRRFPPGWGCPSPEAPNPAASFREILATSRRPISVATDSLRPTVSRSLLPVRWSPAPLVRGTRKTRTTCHRSPPTTGRPSIWIPGRPTRPPVRTRPASGPRPRRCPTQPSALRISPRPPNRNRPSRCPLRPQLPETRPPRVNRALTSLCSLCPTRRPARPCRIRDRSPISIQSPAGQRHSGSGPETQELPDQPLRRRDAALSFGVRRLLDSTDAHEESHGSGLFVGFY